MKANEWTARFFLAKGLIIAGILAVVFCILPTFHLVAVLVFGSEAAVGAIVMFVVLAPLSVGLILLGRSILARLPRAEDVPSDFRSEGDEAEPSALADLGGILMVPVAMLYTPLSLYRNDRKTLALGALVAASVVVMVVLVVLQSTDGRVVHDDLWPALRLIALCSAGPLLCYFALIGLFLPKKAIDDDPSLRALLAHSGFRSMLQLRLVGAFFLIALILLLRFVVLTRYV